MEHFACVQIQRYFSEKEKYKINKLLSNNGVERAGGGVVVLGSTSLKVVNSNDPNYMPAEKERRNTA